MSTPKLQEPWDATSPRICRETVLGHVPLIKPRVKERTYELLKELQTL